MLNVFFDPDEYNVTEGDVAVITVRADRNFTVPFDVIVTLRDGSAVGECTLCSELLMNVQYIHKYV